MNFVTFLILFKIGKHEEAKRYLEINKKLMELLIDEDEKIANIQSRNGIVQSSLSVIMESSQ